MIKDVLSSIFILGGALFMLISSIGMIRFPDFYIRNSASTKAVVLGVFLILLGVGIHYDSIMVFIEIFAIMFFIFLIAPLAAHIVSRAAVITKVDFWDKTDTKDLKAYNAQEKSKKEILDEKDEES